MSAVVKKQMKVKVIIGPRRRADACAGLLAVTAMLLTACSSSNSSTPSASNPPPSASTLTETPLTLTLRLSVADASAADGGVIEASDAGPPPAATLTITATDGMTPVATDLWLYTLDSAGNQTPLTGFTSTQARKSPRLMLPATIAGQPSGLAPADDGRMNGLMSGGNSRGYLDAGTFVSTIDGTVVVSLPTVPASPILVVAGVEDQRYAGGAVIDPDGTPGTVPDGAVVLETHTRRSFQQDVAPLLQGECIACHNPAGPDNAGFYLVAGSRDDLVNDNFALKEQTLDCQQDTDGGAALTACIQAITKAQFLVEPGAPAVSDLLQRSRPDEDAGTSTLGLAWYGGKGQRYNATYGDRRMPSTTQSTNQADWKNAPTAFDLAPAGFQVLYDWVAQGAQP